MSGLGEQGGMIGFVESGMQVQLKDIDQSMQYEVQYPSVDGAFIGTISPVAAGTSSNVVLKNVLPDYPRTLKYTILGVAGGMGGTFTAQFYNQFGSLVTETAGFGTAAGGGTAYGKNICAKFISASVITTGLNGTAIGTCSIGFGTPTGGLGTGNWFGLPGMLAGTGDVKNIVWANNGTMTGLNGGTAIGTLVNTTIHAFQGTSGVAITDYYSVTFKPSFDNLNKGTMFAL